MGVIEELTFEGYGPNGVAILVETMTDNRNRTVADVRHAFSKFGGNMGTDGSVAYLFNKLGLVHVDLSHEEDQIMEIVLDAGADDFTVTEDYFEIITTPANLSAVVEAFKENNIETLLAENTMRADTLVNLDQEASEKVLKIMNFMDDLDDVQEVHTNAEFPEDFSAEE
jgi:YebC/PmpR family DNA-binding regulatory protein